MSDLRLVTPIHALCVYAEPLVARRRVVVVGDASLALDAQLVDLGARSVHVFDPDGERARGHASKAARGASIRELPRADFDVRDGAFDLAIVPDLSAIDDRAELLSRLRRLLGAEGAALVAAPVSGVDYYELYDLVSLQFASVRMIGQVPFAGVAIAELGESEEEPAVSVDTQLLTEAEPPQVFIALASQRDARLDAYAIVQLPRAIAGAEAAAPSPQEQAELAAAVLRAELLETQLEEQRAVSRSLTADAERAKRSVDIEAQLTERASELEAQLKERIAKLREAETRAGDHYVRAERLTHDVRKLDEELARQRDRSTRLTKELEEEKRLRTRAEVDLGMIRKNPELAQARERIALLEEGLRSAEDAVAVMQVRSAEAEQALAVAQQHLATRIAELDALRVEAQTWRVDTQTLEQLSTEVERGEIRTAALESQLIEAAEAQAQELAALEVLLRQRGQAIAALEQELLRRESIARELISALEEARELPSAEADAMEAAAHARALEERASELASEAMREVRDHLAVALAENAELRSKLDALALEVARREGELHTRGWRVTELEEQLSRAERDVPPPVPPPAPAPPPLVPASDDAILALRGELDALRQALTQEHQARVNVESGEELTRARAELARQAVLLEQLSRELDARDRARSPGHVLEESQR